MLNICYGTERFFYIFYCFDQLQNLGKYNATCMQRPDYFKKIKNDNNKRSRFRFHGGDSAPFRGMGTAFHTTPHHSSQNKIFLFR